MAQHHCGHSCEQDHLCLGMANMSWGYTHTHPSAFCCCTSLHPGPDPMCLLPLSSHKNPEPAPWGISSMFMVNASRLQDGRAQASRAAVHK